MPCSFRLARLTTAGLGLLLSGCHYASSPFDGAGRFLANTHTFRINPNRPPGSDENTMRAEGRDVAMAPLLPEPGDIWPGPAAPPPTLSDVQHQQNQEEQQFNPQPTQPPPSHTPRANPRGSSTAPGLYQPQPGPLESPPQVQPAPPITPPATRPPATVLTPSGPLINNGPVGVPGGVGTATNPVTGGQSIVVPNGNGTSTVIGPDGSTQIIPAPR